MEHILGISSGSQSQLHKAHCFNPLLLHSCPCTDHPQVRYMFLLSIIYNWSVQLRTSFPSFYKHPVKAMRAGYERLYLIEEQVICSFWGWTITIGRQEIEMNWHKVFCSLFLSIDGLHLWCLFTVLLSMVKWPVCSFVEQWAAQLCITLYLFPILLHLTSPFPQFHCPVKHWWHLTSASVLFG